MVEGLIPGVRSRRKDRMGIVVALGRSIGGPGACEVFAALGALGALGALRRSLRRSLRGALRTGVGSLGPVAMVERAGFFVGTIGLALLLDLSPKKFAMFGDLYRV